MKVLIVSDTHRKNDLYLDILDKEKESELYWKERDEWREEAASKYDKDPNLTE